MTPNPELGPVDIPAELRGGTWSEDGWKYQAPDGSWWSPPATNVRGFARGALNTSTSWQPSDPPSDRGAFLAKGAAASAGLMAAPFVLGSLAGGGGAAASTSAAGGGGGGILSSLGGVAGGIRAGSALLSGMGDAMTANRTEADNRALSQDALRLRVAEGQAGNMQDRAQTQIQQQTAAQQEQRAAYLNALRGALMQGAQDVSIDRSQFRSNVPTISFAGSPRPSQLGEAGRQAGATLTNQALQTLMNPTKPEPLPEYTPPTLSEPSKASFWEKLIGPLSMAGSALTQPRQTTPLPRPISVGGAFLPGDARA